MAYNITRVFIQFILPMLIVFAVYASIYVRIKGRPTVQNGQLPRLNDTASPARNGIVSSTYLDKENYNRSTQGSLVDQGVAENHNIISRRCTVIEGRKRRANIMIISIAAVFFLSWLPLNSLNVALEISPDLFGSDNDLEGHRRDIHTIGKQYNDIY